MAFSLLHTSLPRLDPLIQLHDGSLQSIGMGKRRKRQTRLTFTLSLGSVLLLTALATNRAYAQIIDPVSPNLSPGLTTNLDFEPVTTLAVDLLAPNRPYMVDPTGASLSANALDPSLYTSSVSGSPAQTDTQIRDSTQSGHLSPYGSAGQRLGLNLSSSDDAASQDNPRTAGAGDFYQSTWGASSSFGTRSDESAWGTSRVSVKQLGRKQSESLAARPGFNGDLATAGKSGDYAGGRSTRSSSRYSLGNSGDNSANSLGSPYGSTGGNSTRSLGSRSGNSGGDSTAASTSRNGGSGLNAIGHGTMDQRATSQNNSGMTPAAGGTNGSKSSGNSGASSNKADLATSELGFFPEAAYSASSLEQSPFSLSSSGDELHFLNPDIFSATSGRRSHSFTDNGSSDENSLRSSARRHALANGASRYGLNTHPETGKLTTGTNAKSTLEKRSHLKTSLLGSENP